MRQFSGNNRKRSDSGDRKPFGKKRFEKPDYKPRKSYSDSDNSSESSSKSDRKPFDGDDRKEKNYSTFSKRAIVGGGSRLRKDDRKDSSERSGRSDSRSDNRSSRPGSGSSSRFRSDDRKDGDRSSRSDSRSDRSSRPSTGGSSRFRSDDRKEGNDRPRFNDSRNDSHSSRPSFGGSSRFRSDDKKDSFNDKPKRSFSSEGTHKDDSKGESFDTERRPYLSKTKYMGEDNRSEKKYDYNRRDARPAFRSKTKPVYDERPTPGKVDDGTLRLNKFISNAGVCSRREADELILSGKVKVNGKITTELGTKVLLTDTITYKGKTLIPEKKVYVLMNKPKDCVTTTDDPEARRTVFDMLKGSVREQLHAVGRLDRNTTGVLLLTNDGELTQTLTHPKFSKSKIYHAWIDRNITESDMKAMQLGVQLEDGFVKPDEVSFVEPSDKTQIGIEIHSGQNRVVRRLFEHFEYKVVKLDRVYFAGLTKKSLPRGEWRFLSNEEVSILKRLSIN
jgi:23S rRNA pseudouridine2605 synthase